MKGFQFITLLLGALLLLSSCSRFNPNSSRGGDYPVVYQGNYYINPYYYRYSEDQDSDYTLPKEDKNNKTKKNNHVIVVVPRDNDMDYYIYRKLEDDNPRGPLPYKQPNTDYYYEYNDHKYHKYNPNEGTIPTDNDSDYTPPKGINNSDDVYIQPLMFD